MPSRALRSRPATVFQPVHGPVEVVGDVVRAAVQYQQRAAQIVGGALGALHQGTTKATAPGGGVDQQLGNLGTVAGIRLG
jgi:hypothetical protein